MQIMTKRQALGAAAFVAAVVVAIAIGAPDWRGFGIGMSGLAVWVVGIGAALLWENHKWSRKQ